MNDLDQFEFDFEFGFFHRFPSYHHYQNSIKLFCGASLFGWFATHTALIISDGLKDNVRVADIAVILGNEVTADGKPSERLKARLEKGLELFQKKQAKILVVSGGIGKSGFDEAKVMAAYLHERKVPTENILLDSGGNNTENTVKNTLNIMKKKNFHSLIVVSQYFHISRVKLAFRKAGMTELSSAHANYFELRDVYSIVREFFAYYVYALK